jgi:DNA (cytosine-5)-methyltransferase 1
MARIASSTTDLVSSQKSQFHVVDLFAGVGGLSYGFSHSKDFKVLAANEILPPMAEAYRLNHPTTKMFEGDIKDFGRGTLKSTFGKDLPKIDVVVGGPPCQAYSTVGKRLLHDPRASLFQEYFRILQELNPKVFIFENVKGLISMNGGELLETIISLFGTLNYKVSYSLLNSADYGAPQTRERVIIVGTKGDGNFDFPKQTNRNPEIPVTLFNSKLPAWITLGDAIGDLPFINAGESSNTYAFDAQNDFQRKMRKAAPKLLMDHNAAKHGEKLITLMDNLPEGGGPKDLPDELRPTSGFPNTYCRLWWDRPSTTVTRNLGTPSSSRCIHPFLSRGLTTREGARIQCFPDSYRFYGSRTEKNLQIGNAVPTFLSEQLSGSVFKYLS